MKTGIEEYTKHYYTGNHLSSTQLVTDGMGVAVQQVEYAPFGEVVNEYNSDWSSGQVPDFKFNGKELDEENGMYYFEARYQSPPVFISRDPLFEKYPWASPYAYCGNNPVINVDIDGREKINCFKKEDKRLHTNAEKAPDDPAIHIYSHGSQGGFTAHMEQADGSIKDISVYSVEAFKEFLSEYSTTWQNRKEGEHITIVLHSCNVGKVENGLECFAEFVSKDAQFENVTIIAPDNFLWGKKDETFVVAPKITDIDGNYKEDKNGKHLMSKTLGHWNYFRNGTLIGTKQGNYNPTAISKNISDVFNKFLDKLKTIFTKINGENNQ
jgi:RHS repeat-associated protein